MYITVPLSTVIAASIIALLIVIMIWVWVYWRIVNLVREVKAFYQQNKHFILLIGLRGIGAAVIGAVIAYSSLYR